MIWSRKEKAKRTNLGACPLSSHRQTQRMTPATVCSSLLQALDIIENISTEIILNLHIRQYSGQVENLLVGQLADATGWVDVETGQETGRGVVANTEEGLKRFLLQMFLR